MRTPQRPAVSRVRTSERRSGCEAKRSVACGFRRPVGPWPLGHRQVGAGCRTCRQATDAGLGQGPGARGAKGLKGGLLPESNPVGLVSPGECPAARSCGRRTRGRAAGRPRQASHKVQAQHKAPATPATPDSPRLASTRSSARRPLRPSARRPPATKCASTCDPPQPTLASPASPVLDPAGGNHHPSPCTSFTSAHSFIFFFSFCPPPPTPTPESDASTTPPTDSTPTPATRDGLLLAPPATPRRPC